MMVFGTSFIHLFGDIPLTLAKLGQHFPGGTNTATIKKQHKQHHHLALCMCVCCNTTFKHMLGQKTITEMKDESSQQYDTVYLHIVPWMWHEHLILIDVWQKPQIHHHVVLHMHLSTQDIC